MKAWKKGAVVGGMFGIVLLLSIGILENLPRNNPIGYLYLIPAKVMTILFGAGLGMGIVFLPFIVIFYMVCGIILSILYRKLRKGEYVQEK